MIGEEKNNPERMEGGLTAKKTKIEQNDPCPCGSGKKYKDCCLAKDEGKAKNAGKAGARGKASARAKSSANSKQATEKENHVDRLAQAKSSSRFKDIKNIKDIKDFKDNIYPDYPYRDAQEIVYDGWELLNSDPNTAARIRSTIFLNPYLIPLVLGEEPEPLPIWHWINLMGLDYAEEYFDWYEELWLGNEEALSFLRFVWEDPAIRKDYGDWICSGAAMQEIKEAGPRRQIIELQRKIEQKKLSKSFLTRLEKFLADKAANKIRLIN